MTAPVKTAPVRTAPGRRRAAPGRGRSGFGQLPMHLIVLVIGAFIVVPLVYGVLGGFKSNQQLSSNPLGLPSPWVPSNYVDVLLSGTFWRQVFNSTFTLSTDAP